jgi:hypothetical protein
MALGMVKRLKEGGNAQRTHSHNIAKSGVFWRLGVICFCFLVSFGPIGLAVSSAVSLFFFFHLGF